MNDPSWYIANSFTSLYGSVRVEELNSWNDRGAPFSKWRVIAEGDEYELPGAWSGEPEFTDGGKFALLLDCFGEKFRVEIDPRKRTFALPTRGEESLEAFRARINAYHSAYRSLAEWASEVHARSIAASLTLALLALGFTAAGIFVLIYLPEGREGWEAWASTATLGLFTVAAFHGLRQDIRKERERRQAREELNRLTRAGP